MHGYPQQRKGAEKDEVGSGFPLTNEPINNKKIERHAPGLCPHVGYSDVQ